MKNITFILLTSFWISGLSSCKEQASTQIEQVPVVSVKAALVQQGDIESTLSLSGKTIYLKKNLVISPIAGYVVGNNIKLGDEVKKNDVLFEIQTKESRALQNGDNPDGKIGFLKVLASSDGIISELNINETGAYVVEGGLLCNIVENRDLLVQVNVPFEYNTLVKKGTDCKIFLSDGTSLDGDIYQVLPVIDEMNQTQNVLIKPIQNTTGAIRQLPENLNLQVQFILARHSKALLIPKAALMTNETQKEFWVMKIVDDSIAIKFPVIPGIQNDSIIEILSSDLKNGDLVISEGAYGLADSTVVKIER